MKRLAPILKNVFFIVFLIPILTSCESRKAIVNQLDEKEANEILVFLGARGINAVKEPSTEGGAGGAQRIPLWNVTVPIEQSTEAMSLLNRAGLPRRRGTNLLGIFSDTGLVPSELAERIRYQAGLAEQIASVIRMMDGVLDAEVQISFPEDDPLNPGRTRGNITASVYVKHSGVLDDPNVQMESKIKRLVTGSITGLDFDHVTVIGDRARFSELQPQFQGPEAGRNLVNIWDIIIANESVTRFRVVFFTLLITVLLLLFSFIWMIWKIFPLLEEKGGFSALFQLQPLIPKEEKEIKDKKKEEESEGDEDEEDEENEEDKDDESEEEDNDSEDDKGVT
ncbi:MAG: type III secretion inner membrane ring lipoprotein SctJ [Waddliaceae bacterium]